MKNISIAKVIAKVIHGVAVSGAGLATWGGVYQRETPSSLKK